MSDSSSKTDAVKPVEKNKSKHWLDRNSDYYVDLVRLDVWSMVVGEIAGWSHDDIADHELLLIDYVVSKNGEVLRDGLMHSELNPDESLYWVTNRRIRALERQVYDRYVAGGKDDDKDGPVLDFNEPAVSEAFDKVLENPKNRLHDIASALADAYKYSGWDEVMDELFKNDSTPLPRPVFDPSATHKQKNVPKTFVSKGKPRYIDWLRRAKYTNRGLIPSLGSDELESTFSELSHNNLSIPDNVSVAVENAEEQWAKRFTQMAETRMSKIDEMYKTMDTLIAQVASLQESINALKTESDDDEEAIDVNEHLDND